MKTSRPVLVFLLGLLFCAPTFAAEKKPEVIAEPTPSKSGNVFVPFVSYRQETSLAGGLIHLAYFDIDSHPDKKRPSSLRSVLMASVTGMVFLQMQPELFWDHSNFRLNGEFLYQSFPDHYYGTGPETSALYEKYTFQNPRVRLNLRRRFWRNLEAGPAIEYENNKIIEPDSGGSLAAGTAPGADGGTISGVGAIVSWDTRDALFFPTRGGYYEATVTTFANALGSDYDFTRTRLDLRRYFKVLDAKVGPHVLGFQTIAQVNSGQPPFNQYSLIGGHRMLRGYWEGRYRDLNMLESQIEYRGWMTRKVGFVAFIGAGNVFHDWDGIFVGGLKPSYGGGLRYAFDAEQRINGRLDVAFGRDTSSFYVQLGEAF